METKVRGKCRFCNQRTTTHLTLRIMGTELRAACPACSVLTCQGCCYIHSRCESHPPKPRSC